MPQDGHRPGSLAGLRIKVPATGGSRQGGHRFSGTLEEAVGCGLVGAGAVLAQEEKARLACRAPLKSLSGLRPRKSRLPWSVTVEGGKSPFSPSSISNRIVLLWVSAATVFASTITWASRTVS